MLRVCFSLIRAHIFQPEYQQWAKENDFESRLSQDVEERAKAAGAELMAKAWLKQQTLDPHLQKKPDRPVPYSDELLAEAALEWLIATDQVSLYMQPRFDLLTVFRCKAHQCFDSSQVQNHD